MARIIDNLIAQVSDPKLRSELAAAVEELGNRRKFGLVFERHLPEETVLYGSGVVPGARVQLRTERSAEDWQVLSVQGEKATLSPISAPLSGEITVEVDDLLTVRPFGDPIYPCLTLVGSTTRSETKPHHAVIGAENFHALQALEYLYEGQADCIYIDPPYNTGDKSWKYNNAFVDSNDRCRHSKWLSMMDRRLRIAKKLLRPDGVLVVTIGEHELQHLGLLLEDIFPEYYRHLITVVMNARGNPEANFARVEEYAFFVAPQLGRDVIVGSRVDYLPESGDIDIDPYDDDMDPDDDEAAAENMAIDESEFELRHARRRGPDSARETRWTMFYPIYIDEDERRVVSAGSPIPLGEAPDHGKVDGLRPIWPINTRGDECRWRWGRDRMQTAIEEGMVRLGNHNRARDTWTINLVVPRVIDKKLKTVWRRTSHDAGTYGSSLLDTFLGEPRLFNFPKSLYAVRDTIAAICRDRPNALIIDFFAGSGTTLHASVLLNREDGGSRRCVLVTNNEVSADEATQLNERGLYRGDASFEAAGIFERVTRPRVEAAITGRRPDGEPVSGQYLDGQPYADGFDENVDFFRLDYLDPDEVSLGRQFDAILPLLWLAAGGIGSPPEVSGAKDWLIAPASPFAVLFSEGKFKRFVAALGERPDITHVWLVTDSDSAFAEMRAELPAHLTVGMLYRDYLRNFRLNLDRNR